jgi:hypothetical protein
MLVGNRPEHAEQAKQVSAGEVTAAVAAAGAMSLVGLSSLVLTGIGTLFAAGAVIAAANAAAASASDSDQSTEAPQQALRRVGFMEKQARAYAMDVQRGYTLLAVDAEDDQADRIADIMHQHGGTKLDFRRRDDAGG